MRQRPLQTSDSETRFDFRNGRNRHSQCSHDISSDKNHRQDREKAAIVIRECRDGDQLDRSRTGESLFDNTPVASWTTVICLGVFIVVFAVSWGPVVWVMLPELFLLHVRGIGTGYPP